MIASLVMAAMLCTIEPNNADRCEVSFEQTYVAKTTSALATDIKDCRAVVKEFGSVEKVDDNHFIMRGCYSVDLKKSPSLAFLVNVDDSEDTFLRSTQDVEVMP